MSLRPLHTERTSAATASELLRTAHQKTDGLKSQGTLSQRQLAAQLQNFGRTLADKHRLTKHSHHNAQVRLLFKPTCPCAFAQNLHESQPSHVCAACTQTFPKSQTQGKSELSFLRWSQGSAPGSRRHRSVPAEAVESLKSPTWQISSAGSIDHKCMPRRGLADSPLIRCDTASFSQCGGQVKHAHACKRLQTTSPKRRGTFLRTVAGPTKEGRELGGERSNCSARTLWSSLPASAWVKPSSIRQHMLELQRLL